MRARLASMASGVIAVGTKELRGRMRGPRAFIGVTIYLAILAGVSVLVYTVQRDLASTQTSFSGGNQYASAQIGQAPSHPAFLRPVASWPRQRRRGPSAWSAISRRSTC
jgi:hypothetical protein